MILLWGISGDCPMAMVHAALSRAGAPVVFLDQQAVVQTSIELDLLDSAVSGTLKTADWTLDLATVSACYLRPYDIRRMTALKDLEPTSTIVQCAFRFEDALSCWIEMTPALVVNRPSAMASNNSKPYQLELIRAAGFSVPDTLVTTDPAAAMEFHELHGEVIYKSVSGMRSIVTRLGMKDRDRLGDIAHCPTQFQEHIQGTDFRVHVVGEEMFGCEINSAADDYRYPGRQGAAVEVQACEVPEAVTQRCRRLAESLCLPVAGIDLRRTYSGKWYCFEANPSPGFSFYEEAAGQPVSEAIARLLMRGHSNVSSDTTPAK